MIRKLLRSCYWYERKGLTFVLTDAQKDKISKWAKDKNPAYSTLGRITYCFTPTRDGLMVKVHDRLDNAELDVSNDECT